MALSAAAPKNIPDEMKLKVVQVLFEQNPALVRRALVDETALTALMDRVAKEGMRLGQLVRAMSVTQGPGRFSENLQQQVQEGLTGG